MLRARALSFRPRWIEKLSRTGEAVSRGAVPEAHNVKAMVGLAITLAIHSRVVGRLGRGQGQAAPRTQRDLALKVRANDPGLRGIELPLYLYALEHNDFEGARHALEAALPKDPKDPSAYGNYAVLSYGHGQAGACNPRYSSKPCPVPQGKRVHFLTTLAFRTWHWEATMSAIEWLLKAVDLNTEIRDVYSGLAMAYSNKGAPANSASRYVARVPETGDRPRLQGDRSNPPSPGSPPAYLKYYHDRFCRSREKAVP